MAAMPIMQRHYRDEDSLTGAVTPHFMKGGIGGKPSIAKQYGHQRDEAEI
jgi:hypothetical protein